MKIERNELLVFLAGAVAQYCNIVDPPTQFHTHMLVCHLWVHKVAMQPREQTTSTLWMCKLIALLANTRNCPGAFAKQCISTTMDKELRENNSVALSIMALNKGEKAWTSCVQPIGRAALVVRKRSEFGKAACSRVLPNLW